MEVLYNLVYNGTSQMILIKGWFKNRVLMITDDSGAKAF